MRNKPALATDFNLIIQLQRNNNRILGGQIMTIEKNINGSEMTVTLTGRLDTTTSPQLEAEFKKSIDGVDYLILDFKNLEYLSSAGLRVLLAVQKVMNKQGKMVIRNVNDTISEVFEITGFADILTIE
jgi:anti-sigma B factor antagonist